MEQAVSQSNENRAICRQWVYVKYELGGIIESRRSYVLVETPLFV